MSRLILFAAAGLLVSSAAQAANPLTKLLSSLAAKETVAKEYTARDGSIFRYRWHEPAVKAPGKKYPLVVLLHGAGERGTNNVSQLLWGANPLFGYMKKRGEEFFFLAGQVPARKRWVDVSWGSAAHSLPEKPSETMAQLIEVLEQVRTGEPAIDPERWYVTGVSMGGYGTFDLVSRRPAWFAAALPICGGADTAQAAALRDLPIFIHHGDIDSVVPVWRARSMIAALREAGSLVARYTEHPGIGHGSWLPAYRDAKNFDWLFSKKRPAAAEWKPVSLATPPMAPAKYYEVAFEFSTDGGARWQRGLVRRGAGFPLRLVDDRVSPRPDYVFRELPQGRWTLESPENRRVQFRKAAVRPLPCVSK